MSEDTHIHTYTWASLVAQLVKDLPAIWETWARSLGWEDPLEKGKATYPRQHTGLENSMDCIVHGVAKSQTQLSDFHFLSTYFLLLSPPMIEKNQSTPSMMLKDEIICHLH